MRYFLGLDISVTHTGVAIIGESDSLRGFPLAGGFLQIVRTDTIHSKFRGVERLDDIYTRVRAIIGMYDGQICSGCIEGYSFASRFSRAHALGEVGGILRLLLHRKKITYRSVAPLTLKKFLTGNGKAGKWDIIKSIYDRYKIEFTDDNQSDAAVLAMMSYAIWRVQNGLNTSTLKKYEQECVKTVLSRGETNG